MTAQMRHDADHVNLVGGHELGCEAEQLLGGDPRLVRGGRLADRNVVVEELRGRVQPVVVGSQPKPNGGAAARSTSRVAYEHHLTGTVERDPAPGLDRARDQVGMLHGAVHRDSIRRHTASKCRLELTRPERVAAGPLLREDPSQGEGEVRLDRRQKHDVSVGPRRSKRRCEPARVPPELALGDHVQRRPEASRELERVALLDPQVTVSGRQAIVDRERCPHPSAHVLLSSGRWAGRSHPTPSAPRSRARGTRAGGRTSPSWGTRADFRPPRSPVA